MIRTFLVSSMRKNRKNDFFDVIGNGRLPVKNVFDLNIDSFSTVPNSV